MFAVAATASSGVGFMLALRCSRDVQILPVGRAITFRFEENSELMRSSLAAEIAAGNTEAGRAGDRDVTVQSVHPWVLKIGPRTVSLVAQLLKFFTALVNAFTECLQ